MTRKEFHALILEAYNARARLSYLEITRKEDTNTYPAEQEVDVWTARLLAAHDAQAARIQELEAALRELYEQAEGVEDQGADDGDGYYDSWQSRDLEKALAKAMRALDHKEA